jgi:hypothetical protein
MTHQGLWRFGGVRASPHNAPAVTLPSDWAGWAHSPALGAAWLGVQGLPQTMTAVRTKLLAKLPSPTLPPRGGRLAGAA